MTQQERKSRIIAFGEHSGHCHVVTGDALVERNNNGEIIIEIGNSGAILRHIMETSWMEGKEVWTEEHHDINLSDMPEQVRHGDVMLEKIGERKYKYIQQMVFDPLTKRIEAAQD